MRATALLLCLLYTAPAAAQVSATAAPISNSSGSVVNQAVQITPGQYMKYSVGSGIQCDGATLNISPFVSSTHSFGKPDNQYYQEPVYDNSDNFGLVDPETGLDGPDGIPDNPGNILYYKPQRTGYRSNFGSQGTIGQQRNEFVIHDPYPSNDLGPPIVGGRPRGFDRPFAEATDVQGSPYARRNGRMPNY